MGDDAVKDGAMPDGATTTRPGGSGAREAGVVATIKGPGFIMSSRRLWLLSCSLHRAGRRRAARWVKNFNSILYHNSLPPQAKVSPDIRLGHQGFGTVLHPKIVIGRRVKIFQNVTMAVRPPNGAGEIVIEDDVVIGANAVIMTPRHRDVRIGRGARVGAGAVVTHDVPAHTIAISQPVELRPRGGASDDEDDDDGEE
jgi:serine O-acetyltransferase